MLTAHEIRLRANTKSGPRIVIDPFNLDNLNPNSYDLTLADTLATYKRHKALDVRVSPEVEAIQIPVGGIVLKPHELYLGATVEYTESHGFVPMINGKSSLARLGISVHQTGGFGDIGFCGNWTLEITCVMPVRIFTGMRFAQLCWFTPNGFIDMRYKGRYQGSKSASPVPSRMCEDWLGERK